jgi:hypothetical protein
MNPLASQTTDIIVAATGVGLFIVAATTLLLRCRSDRPSRKQRAEDEAAADRRSRSNAVMAADVALAGKPWRLESRLRVPVGDAQPDAPIAITSVGASVWVHDVRLTWRPQQPALAHWVVKDEPCAPWRGSLPQELEADGRPLLFAWPGPAPRQQEPIMQKIEVTYSALRDGPRQQREVQNRQVGWQ